MNGTERSEAEARSLSERPDPTAESCLNSLHGHGVVDQHAKMHMTKDVVAGPAGPAPGPEPGKSMPVELQGHLGSQLRAIYGALVNEPVPDKFFHLLKELEAKEKQAR